MVTLLTSFTMRENYAGETHSSIQSLLSLCETKEIQGNFKLLKENTKLSPSLPSPGLLLF